MSTANQAQKQQRRGPRFEQKQRRAPRFTNTGYIKNTPQRTGYRQFLAAELREKTEIDPYDKQRLIETLRNKYAFTRGQANGVIMRTLRANKGAKSNE